MPLRTRAPQTPHSTTITLVINNTPLSIDTALLTKQAAALGRVLGPSPRRPSVSDATILEGAWNFLHSLLDAAGHAAQPVAHPVHRQASPS